MLAPLLTYIRERSITPLTDADLSLLQEAFIPAKLRKRQFFLKEGEVCEYFAFIVKGAMRQYRIDADGQLQILNLCIENWWMSDRESFHKATPTIYNIDAWEETDVLLLPKANNYYDRVNAIPAFNEMRIRLDDNHHIASQRRLLAAMNQTAAYRYQALLKSYPGFIDRFPQHMIASYLGITKETLSRVRRGKR